MKKHLILLGIFFTLFSSAQTTAIFYDFNTKKHSLEDLKTGKIISSGYDELYQLKDGRYHFQINQKRGLLNQDGSLGLASEYQQIFIQKNGYYQIQKNYKKGVLDNNLKEIVPPKYTRISVYKNYIAAFKKDTLGAFDLKGKLIIPFEYERSSMTEPSYFRFNKNGKAGVIDSLNNVIIPFEYDWIEKFSNRVADFEYMDDNQFAKNELYSAIKENGLKDIKCGVYNSKGELLIPVMYENVFSVYAGNLIGVTLNKKAGFVNLKNEVVVPLMYDEALAFSSGLSCVKLNNKYGAVNDKNEIVIPIIYPDYLIFKKGLAKFKAYIDNKTKYGFINSTGKIVIPAQYDDAEYLTTGYFRVRKDKSYGIVSLEGKEVIPPIYNGGIIVYTMNITNPGTDNTDKFVVVKDQKYGVINSQNKTLIPLEYSYIASSGNMTTVCKNGLYGFYDAQFKLIIPPTYLNARHGRNSPRISVLDKDKKAYNIDLKGKRTTVSE